MNMNLKQNGRAWTGFIRFRTGKLAGSFENVMNLWVTLHVR
jgi:hypothetical protein